MVSDNNQVRIEQIWNFSYSLFFQTECFLLSILPPAIISLLLPYLDLDSLLHLEQSCHLLHQVVLASGEYFRRFRRISGGQENQENMNIVYCKHQLKQLVLLAKNKTYCSDHRVSQNLCFTRSEILLKNWQSWSLISDIQETKPFTLQIIELIRIHIYWMKNNGNMGGVDWS